eukprot:6458810-Amphidinium_carterae.1
MAHPAALASLTLGCRTAPSVYIGPIGDFSGSLQCCTAAASLPVVCKKRSPSVLKRRLAKSLPNFCLPVVLLHSCTQWGKCRSRACANAGQSKALCHWSAYGCPHKAQLACAANCRRYSFAWSHVAPAGSACSAHLWSG